MEGIDSRLATERLWPSAAYCRLARVGSSWHELSNCVGYDDAMERIAYLTNWFDRCNVLALTWPEVALALGSREQLNSIDDCTCARVHGESESDWW